MSTWMKGMVVAVIAASACCGASAQVNYTGMCDASAAVGLRNSHFVVADDESNVLRIYKRGTSTPVDAVDLTDHLRNRKANGDPAEADIEGAAKIANRVYWISSHARKGKDASIDRHRHRFFAVEVLGNAQAPFVKPVGRPVESLLEALLADASGALLIEAARLGPETAKGLNIEGLAATADGKLLIGFRNPRPGGKALVVPLLNPASAVDTGAKPRFGELVRLDLGGRGIRSMERVGNEVVIAAGPHGPAQRDSVQPAFALFRWSGLAHEAPTFVRGIDAGTERAEAVFADEDANELVVLSDDGDEQVGARDCKHKKVPLGRKSFRSRTFPLPLADVGS